MSLRKIKSEILKTPKLRLGGSLAKWKQGTLKDVVVGHNSGVYKKADLYGDGSNIIGVSNLYDISSINGQIFRKVPLDKTELESFTLNEGDLIYGESSLVKEGIAKTLFTTRDGAGTAFAWHTRRYSVNTKEVVPQFVYYFLNSVNVRKYLMSVATQTALTGITTKDYFSVPIMIPALDEQKSISVFLESVDDLIKNLNQQREFLQIYKIGVVNKILSQEIRFKDQNGKEFPEWTEKRLGEILIYEQPTKYIVKSTDYNDKYQTPVLTAGKTFILGYTNETEGIFDKSKLPVIIFDDFTTASQFVNFPFKVKSSAMKILTANREMSARFIYEAMQLIRFTVGGHGRHWISMFSKMPLLVPSLPEQKKIEEYLTCIDDLIESTQQRIDQTVLWKKGLMQQLFT